MGKTVHIHYFAMLREQRGLSSESAVTTAASLAELYHEIAERHGFRLAPEQIRAAVNGAFCPMSSEIVDGSDIVFVPPVAGG